MLNRKPKEPWSKPFSEKIFKRIQRIPSAELEMWADRYIDELGRCMSGYLRTREALYLNEALNGAEALHAVLDTLNIRDTLKRQ